MKLGMDEKAKVFGLPREAGLAVLGLFMAVALYLFYDNVLATPQAVLCNGKFERFEAVFSGAGDTLSAALAALVASGTDLAAAATEALAYLDRCLDAGFRPGMGNVVPDRLFWAQPEGESGELTPEEAQALQVLDMPAHDTKH